MNNTILERISAWKLERRLPFYVQLSHACPEDLGPRVSTSILASVWQVYRLLRDFVGWKHPITYSARRDFVKTSLENRRPNSTHAQNFAYWQDQCLTALTETKEVSSPPYYTLYPSIAYLLDRYRTPEIDPDWLKENDEWFQNVCSTGEEICKPAYSDEFDACLVWLEESQAESNRSNTPEWEEGSRVEHYSYYSDDEPQGPIYDADDYGSDDYEMEVDGFVDDFGNEEP
jgi:hypothetical protein